MLCLPLAAAGQSAKSVPYFPAASDPLGRQGFVQVMNLSDSAGTVSITAFDDGGREAGPVSLSLDARQTRHFNSGDLQDGNPAKGLPTGIGAPTTGDWRLELASQLNVNVLSYIRTSDGFVTSMHGVAPSMGGTHHVAFFNPGSNFRQESLLRMVNPGGAAAAVTIEAVDNGGSPGGPVTLTIRAGAARTLSAADLEDGAAGIGGALGDGAGKWRLAVSADGPIRVLSLLSTPTGHLTNLSTVPGGFSFPGRLPTGTGGGGGGSPGQAFRDCPECPLMVVVPSGSFRMGCLSNNWDCFPDEFPAHAVTIAQPFAMGAHEVTFAQWEACVAGGGCGGHQPDDRGWGRGDRPVIDVSWEDARAYASWLSSRTGHGYRLPSESEWEYAARSGTVTKHWWGDEIGVNRANCAGCGSQWDGQSTAPVGSFAASPWGLHDMHGNVWEWVEDCWNGDYEGAPSDGSAWNPGNCNLRVVRGGSWADSLSPWNLRSADRNWGIPGSRSYIIVGFRVARTLTP